MTHLETELNRLLLSWAVLLKYFPRIPEATLFPETNLGGGVGIKSLDLGVEAGNTKKASSAGVCLPQHVPI